MASHDFKEWQRKVLRPYEIFDGIKFALAISVILLVVGLAAWRIWHGPTVTQIERVTADGQRVTCFVPEGVYGSITCIPAKEE
jgi:predicted negative regulator of RcsB-dependent stress response